MVVNSWLEVSGVILPCGMLASEVHSCSILAPASLTKLAILWLISANIIKNMAPPNPLTKTMNPTKPLLPASKTKQDMTLQIAIMSALKYAKIVATV